MNTFVTIRVSFDPVVTAEERALLEARPELLHPAGGVRPSGSVGGRTPRDVLFSLWSAPLWAFLPLVVAPFYGRKVAVAGAIGQVAAVAVLLLVPWGVVVLSGVAVVAFGVLVARCGEGRVGTLARRLHGSYVLPGDLNTTSSDLLGRLQEAVRVVLSADVTKEGMLDDLRNAVVLPAQEWEVAQTLREISRLRREQRAARKAGESAELAQVMEPQTRALNLARASIAERVEAIERYAEQVKAADQALLQWKTLQRLADNNDAYGELLARTVRDELAIAEIEGLTEEAAQVEEALRRSVEKARRTGFSLLPGGLAEAG
ncbi:hypothetical protein GCM10022254_59120 [Actinomadura meridiana]|uniref:5-bromo-4-chloroindolyl phosphate hydrolysis protein n=1 Tax=Actinomadura meridiana TaxID=559626 RepID=A0ABP8CHL7_9ACTN